MTDNFEENIANYTQQQNNTEEAKTEMIAGWKHKRVLVS